jgi:hypothetical protein
MQKKILQYVLYVASVPGDRAQKEKTLSDVDLSAAQGTKQYQ